MHNKVSNKLSKFTKKELDHFFESAKSPKKNQAFTFLTAPATANFGRILVVASRKYGNAPERNLLRRRLKAIFWEEKLYEKKIDLAVIARPAGKSYDFAQLKTLVLEIFYAIDRCIAQILIWLIIQSRPLLGPPGVCPFVIGCTQYSIMQLESLMVPVAIWKTSTRLLRCNPFWLHWHSKA